MTSTPEMLFATRLRAARKAAGFTQERLADLLNDGFTIRITGVALHRMEAGKRQIRLNEACALAVILKIDEFDLLPPKVTA
jgi:transcriptional regulator with XRE-family HTH domain